MKNNMKTKVTQNILMQEANILKSSHQNIIEQYCSIIKQLQNTIQELLQKNSFLNQDRFMLLKQNSILKNQLLCNPPQKTKIGSMMKQSFQKNNESFYRNSQSLLLKQSLKQSFNLYMPIKQKLWTKLNEFQQISSVYRTHSNFEGIIRSVYLNVYKIIPQQLKMLVESYRNQSTYILYQAYPCNQFCVDLLLKFLSTSFDNVDTVIQRLNQFVLIDYLLCKMLKNRIAGMINLTSKQYFQEQNELTAVDECFLALANQFNLKLNIENQVYKFSFIDQNNLSQASFRDKQKQSLFKIIYSKKHIDVIIDSQIIQKNSISFYSSINKSCLLIEQRDQKDDKQNKKTKHETNKKINNQMSLRIKNMILSNNSSSLSSLETLLLGTPSSLGILKESHYIQFEDFKDKIIESSSKKQYSKDFDGLLQSFGSDKSFQKQNNHFASNVY